jgi:hypothetical protein
VEYLANNLFLGYVNLYETQKKKHVRIPNQGAIENYTIKEITTVIGSGKQCMAMIKHVR